MPATPPGQGLEPIRRDGDRPEPVHAGDHAISGGGFIDLSRQAVGRLETTPGQKTMVS